MDGLTWVKLSVDIFDNRKIKYLRTLPDGDKLVLIWVMLLTMAGRNNADGLVYITEKIPYSPEMLACELGFETSVMTLALTMFEQLDMVSTENGHLCVTDWGAHQNSDALEKIREQNRLRQQRFREKRNRLLPAGDNNNTVTLPVTLNNAVEEDKDVENLYCDKSQNNVSVSEKPKKKFVPPSVEEVEQYIREKDLNVDAKTFVEYFEANDWHDSTGRKVKSWKQKLQTWNKNSLNNRQGQKTEAPELKGVRHF